MTGIGIQVDDGDFTRLHNTILEKLALARFTATEYRCLMYLFRATYGWQKKEDVISLSQWCKGTGIDPEKRHNALRTLNGLVAKRVIYCKSNGNNHASTWGFNKHFDHWDASLFQETVITQDNSHSGESVMQDDNSYAPTVITPDNRGVITQDNKTVITGDNYKRKKEILKKEERESAPPRIAAPQEPARKIVPFRSPHVDPRHFVNGFIPPGKGTTPVEVYYERFDIRQDAARLSAILEDDLVHACPDLERLRRVIVAYSQHQNYRPGNVALILDWYRDGIPKKDNAPSSNGVYKNGAPGKADRDTVLARARLARESIKTAELTGMPVRDEWRKAIEAAREYA